MDRSAARPRWVLLPVAPAPRSEKRCPKVRRYSLVRVRVDASADAMLDGERSGSWPAGGGL